jgi:hypothetical protein
MQTRFIPLVLKINFVLFSFAVATQSLAVEISDTHPIRTCNTHLPPKVDAALKIALVTKEYTKPAYPHSDIADPALLELFTRKDGVALETKVALSAYYIGEAPGAMLQMAIGEQAKRAIPLVKKYKKCRPLTSFEEQIPKVHVFSTGYIYLDEDLARFRNSTPIPREASVISK